ncbi:MAG: glutathione-independent formaldehyde dehydrogenase [Candidatus Methanoperedens nitroreducens]|uniref:Glutathione-independent formaldehyde dehydrogenase n=1 Tax=Candidatus Methanoperedens nitratireducens TaxID=1392998 RepID=A0A0P8A8C6_9EURY|nr:alcohol dehydrogenase catalytic domain-containing protein [Candidatus Methanoperedens sp. BLZ2]KAB2945741.1 MAG: alcohol dehydrogenase catalytic domain-containing protein [Candidatus Methanoperedens sp.]KPQ44448.1 MAG: glutathione-independent formaldehyde dehydrogenase [Candidatus Methanoperedens sp. BLZ1]MBZ0177447.1 alcohol dehydrogenase catalytic domain-containing protein [Candidatus Methanoperedens nitroreducens]CAG1004588.1 L-iditol 2-dehydrogenase [Methanosarcinales archaeon]MCX907983
MKTAVYYNNNDIRIEERPKPEIKSGEILVKVKASGICGTDLMEWYRIKKAPRVLGHEMTGEIVGSKSDKFKVGQRVFVSHHVPCNECKYCISGNHTACETLHKGNYDPGGFSEFVRIPEINVNSGTYLLPDNISYEEGTMIEPLACVVRAQRIIDVRAGQTVLVMGSGISGLLNIAMAKLKNARVIATDINNYRLRKAGEFGADEVFNASEELDLKADRIIMCTGAMSAFEAAFRYIDKKGVIMLFAIPNKNLSIPVEDFWRNELSIVSSYGAAPVDLEEALALIKDKKINVRDMITDRVRLEDIQKGFKIAGEARESLKVIVVPE